jgi:hypothetical protein
VLVASIPWHQSRNVVPRRAMCCRAAVLPCVVPCMPLDVFCRYGFGVGGEYPMASASAAESSQADESTRNKRGQQVVLTFSGQVRPLFCLGGLEGVGRVRPYTERKARIWDGEIKWLQQDGMYCKGCGTIMPHRHLPPVLLRAARQMSQRATNESSRWC